ncbi:hypothetical protein MHU86_8857 [Fragilaria crotonensis]|nr:hypothetical protein MHU86_8857 [Fragilaria crotonensis]
MKTTNKLPPSVSMLISSLLVLFSLSLSRYLNLHPFIHEVTEWLDSHEVSWTYDAETEGTCCMLAISNQTTKLHLLPTKPRSPTLTKELTDARTNETIIHLHQDVWNQHPTIVHARLFHKLALFAVGRGPANQQHHQFQRVFARKTTAQRLSKHEAVAFLTQHHLWGGVSNCKHYYGLMYPRHHEDNEDKEMELVAVAAFSAPRNVMRRGRIHRSVELVRYCSKGAVVGGISKLVKTFIRNHSPDDIVTIIDRDWGGADGWYSLGFEPCQSLPPSLWVVETQTGIRTSLVGQLDETKLPFLTDLAIDPSENTLSRHGYVAIYGAGMERLLMICNDASETAQDLWDQSIPSYPHSYYSARPGVATLLQKAEDACRAGNSI